MIQFFLRLNPIYQALLAGSFTFFITVLGSSIVFFFRGVKAIVMDGMMALSAGIMLAAAFFSLLNPAVEISDNLALCTWLVILCGFLSGGILLWLGNITFQSFSQEKISTLRRSILLFFSITLHNIPEGLVVGVAFGAANFSTNQMASIVSAILLTVGIAVQNFPEGSAISLPMRRDGISSFKAFCFGSLSALVEPIFAVIGAVLVLQVQSLLPFVMSLAAGAMIFVVAQELIPEVMQNKRKDWMSLLIMLGFSIMMILEITLG